MTRIIFAPQDMISRFPEGRVRFLDLGGIRAALITDESTLRDFSLGTAERRRLALALGYLPHEDTCIWKLARDLEKE